MLSISNKEILLTIVLFALALTSASVRADSLPMKKHHTAGNTSYQVYGQIAEIDKGKRRLTIATNNITQKDNKKFLSIEKKSYEIAIGVKLKNVPKSMKYSGLNKLQKGTLVYFNLKRGTEKNSIPTISEMWVDFQ